MIRVSMSGKPHIKFNKSSNDMSHFFPSEFSVSYYFYMSMNDYMEKTEFENFDMKPNLSKEEVKKMTTRALNKEDIKIEEAIFSPGINYLYNMQRLIKKSGGQIWQFNVVNKDLDGWIRQTCVLGQKSIIRWTWIDVYIKLPILNFLCRIANKFLYFKRGKEIKEWDEFLDGIHKRRG